MTPNVLIYQINGELETAQVREGVMSAVVTLSVEKSARNVAVVVVQKKVQQCCFYMILPSSRQMFDFVLF